MESHLQEESVNVEQFLEQVLGLIASVSEGSANNSLLPMVRRCLATQGKLTRPRSIYYLARIFQVPADHAVAWACACELLHSASLVHDDLQDGDRVRRGAPTMWVEFGLDMAINLGDYLLLVAPDAIMNSEMDSQLKVEVYREYIKMSAQMVGGQCDEFRLNRMTKEQDLYDQYLNCIGGKTAVFFAKIARGVGILGGQPPQMLDAVEDLFFQIGLVFQIQDDILDLYGDKKRDKIGCDIREGKVSALIVHHLNLYPDRFSIMKAILSQKRSTVTDAQVKDLRDRFQQDGTLSKACEDLNTRVRRILSHDEIQSNLGLRGLVTALLKDITRPVDHILPQDLLSSDTLTMAF